MKSKKLIVILALILAFTIFITSTNATEIIEDLTGGNKFYIYNEVITYDGIEFSVRISDSGTISIEAEGEYDGRLTLNSDGTCSAYAYNNENKCKENYVLEISDLSEEKVNVEVWNENGEKVKTYTSYQEIIPDVYTGQASIVIGGGISLLLLLKILLGLALTVIIGGIVYYAVPRVIEKIKQNSYISKYYRAYLGSKTIFVALYHSISKTSATNRVASGQNIYTFYSTNARSAVSNTGLGYTHDEAHRKPKQFTFNHYHTANRNGAHAWYGLPYYDV